MFRSSIWKTSTRTFSSYPTNKVPTAKHQLYRRRFFLIISTSFKLFNEIIFLIVFKMSYLPFRVIFIIKTLRFPRLLWLRTLFHVLFSGWLCPKRLSNLYSREIFVDDANETPLWPFYTELAGCWWQFMWA